MTTERNILRATIISSLAESIVFPVIDDLLPAADAGHGHLNQVGRDERFQR
ncbi:MAG TPA: hypothetical protein VJX67_03875 [Blastocatellia bacterium]|nr:hypothetical protein [Blastocatellia bacterium]